MKTREEAVQLQQHQKLSREKVQLIVREKRNAIFQNGEVRLEKLSEWLKDCANEENFSLVAN